MTTRRLRGRHSLTLCVCSSHFDLLSPSDPRVCRVLYPAPLRAPALTLLSPLCLRSAGAPARSRRERDSRVLHSQCTAMVRRQRRRYTRSTRHTASVRSFVDGDDKTSPALELYCALRSPFSGLFLTNCLHTHIQPAAAGGELLLQSSLTLLLQS